MIAPPEIYLDYNACHPLTPAVRECIERHLHDNRLGNPSSSHLPGQRARALLEEARDRILAASGLRHHALIFTSGGTESNRRVVRRLVEGWGSSDGLFLTGDLEHPSMREAVHHFVPATNIRSVPVTPAGFYDVASEIVDVFANEAASPKAASLQAANNELGTVQDLTTLRQRLTQDVLLHSDATQYWFRWSDDLAKLPVDALTVSAHKLGALPGVGGLFLDEARLPPIDPVTSQEKGWRPGTENLLGILTFAVAVEERRTTFDQDARRMRQLLDRLSHGLVDSIPGLHVNNAVEPRLPNTLNVRFPHGDGRSLLLALQLAGLALSPGSACASGASTPSPVLLALGSTDEEARRSVRISIGANTTTADIDEAVMRMAQVAHRFAP
ncbi:MAG: aminotransferase class V-fold PLP-dependent enzyme [Planctomycetes bacterium]|nr:aminotransferase class V-fold PLP-dependent enzyme [Planctomycetota bacterium]